ncbi:hypothetical protein LguiB_001732 [Lonicera macranthoides]
MMMAPTRVDPTPPWTDGTSNSIPSLTFLRRSIVLVWQTDYYICWRSPRGVGATLGVTDVVPIHWPEPV